MSSAEPLAFQLKDVTMEATLPHPWRIVHYFEEGEFLGLGRANNMQDENRKKLRPWVTIALVLAVLNLGFLAFKSNQSAEAARLAQVSATPTSFNYQGILRDVDGSLITGKRDITLKIYGSVMGNDVLHTESFTGVNVRDGVFNVVLGGDVTPLTAEIFGDSPRFLGVTVAPDPEMVPRQRLHPVPWAAHADIAVRANNASTANQANTLIANATVPGLTVNTSLKLPNYSYLRIETAPDAQSYPYFSMGGQGQFLIDAPNQTGGRFKILQNGNVGIGTTDNPVSKLYVNGNITAATRIVAGDNITSQKKVIANGGFNGKCIQDGEVWHGTCNQDVAETFAATELTEPGDVVVLQPRRAEDPTVKLSKGAYADQLMGVVSSNPGLVFDDGKTFLAGNNSELISEDKTVVAMIGRVPVKISLENGGIAEGDPLASSSIAGTAMRARKAGQIIGYALQSSNEMVDGKIMVWLQLGYYIPPQILEELNDIPEYDYAITEQSGSTLDESSLEQELAGLEAENAFLSEHIKELAQRIEALEGER